MTRNIIHSHRKQTEQNETNKETNRNTKRFIIFRSTLHSHFTSWQTEKNTTRASGTKFSQHNFLFFSSHSEHLETEWFSQTRGIFGYLCLVAVAVATTVPRRALAVDKRWHGNGIKPKRRRKKIFRLHVPVFY